MIIPDFEYHCPKTVKEACTLLAGFDGESAVLAGGTELLVEAKMSGRNFDHLVSLSGIAELKCIAMRGEDLCLGAMVTPGELSRSDLVQEHFPEIAEVSRVFAAVQVGNRATIGGNIAAAVPSADFPPILIALGASIEVRGPEGPFTLAVEDTFSGPRQSVLNKGEVIVNILLPPKEKGVGVKYVKFGLRDSGACCVTGAAAVVQLDGGLCRSARLVLSAVAPTPMRVSGIEALLKDREPDKAAIAEAAALAQSSCKPISDIRASKSYRSDIVKTISARALAGAIKRAQASIDKG